MLTFICQSVCGARGWSESDPHYANTQATLRTLWRVLTSRADQDNDSKVSIHGGRKCWVGLTHWYVHTWDTHWSIYFIMFNECLKMCETLSIWLVKVHSYSGKPKSQKITQHAIALAAPVGLVRFLLVSAVTLSRLPTSQHQADKWVGSACTCGRRTQRLWLMAGNDCG